MLLVTLDDSVCANGGAFVFIGAVARAIAEANGSKDVLTAERKMFARVNAGVQCGELHPFDPDTLAPLSKTDYGHGIVAIEELVTWGRSRLPPFDFNPPAPVADASDGHVPLTKAPAWNLKRPTRFQGYGKPLYDFLKAAHIAGKPKPTARDLLDAWKIKPPPDVFEVTDNGLKYYDAKGNTKPADLDAIRKAIGRMTQ